MRYVQVVEENEKCFLDRDKTRVQGDESLSESGNLRTQGTAQRRIRLQTRLQKPPIALKNTARDLNRSEEEARRSKVTGFLSSYIKSIISIRKIILY